MADQERPGEQNPEQRPDRDRDRGTDGPGNRHASGEGGRDADRRGQADRRDHEDRGRQGGRGYRGDRRDDRREAGDRGRQGNRGYQGDRRDRDDRDRRDDRRYQGDRRQAEHRDQNDRGRSGGRGQEERGYRGDRGRPGDRRDQGERRYQDDRGRPGDRRDQGERGYQDDRGRQENGRDQGERRYQDDRGRQADRRDRGDRDRGDRDRGDRDRGDRGRRDADRGHERGRGADPDRARTSAHGRDGDRRRDDHRQDHRRDHRDRRHGSRGPSGPPPRRPSPQPPATRDPARQAAFDTLRAISTRDAYANLALPALLRQRRITGRDAALATELCYGTARATGLLDTILQACMDRELSTVDEVVLDGLRLGAYQLLRTRIPPHAAVSSTVDLVSDEVGAKLAGFVNAVLRKVSEQDEDAWVAQLAPENPVDAIALRTAHPGWIARAFGAALGDNGDELAAALAADDARPMVHLAARPGEISADELAAITGGDLAQYSPYGVYLESGDPGDLGPIREHLAHVQDEGSQLCALAAANAPVDGPDQRWLDLCAGPGGKAALLGALAATTGATLDAVEQSERRAELVRDACEGLPVTVHVADGRDAGLAPGFDRVLVDAPCTGLGALRRRPEARWRRSPGDVADLAKLQRELLTAALALTRPGGVVTYVVCSPHLPETISVLSTVLRKETGVSTVDTRELFPGVPQLGEGPHVQLWPHRHGTDAMFCAVLRKNAT